MPSEPIHSRTSPPKEVQEALSRLPESAWRLVQTTADHLIYETTIDIAGVPTIARRSVARADQLLQDLNRHEFEASHHKRFGGGRVVGRIPMNLLFGNSEIAQRIDDRDHLKWWLNQPDNAPFRTFRGRI